MLKWLSIASPKSSILLQRVPYFYLHYSRKREKQKKKKERDIFQFALGFVSFDRGPKGRASQVSPDEFIDAADYTPSSSSSSERDMKVHWKDSSYRWKGISTYTQNTHTNNLSCENFCVNSHILFLFLFSAEHFSFYNNSPL